MQELENMQGLMEEKFSPLSNRRKSGILSHLPVLAYPFWSASDSVCSLDMVRLRLRFEGEGKGEKLDRLAERLPVICDYQSWVARVKPGGWRVLHNFCFGESSVSLGIGLMAANCSVDMAVGFLEFNPNKLAGNPEFVRLLGLIAPYVSWAELVRYDLACDVPVSRDDVRLAKDGRKYKCEISGSMTEYLGRRNAAGYVKVYDKQAESELDGPLTRIELTCGADWSLERVGEKWPRVYRVRQFGAESGQISGLSSVLSRFVKALSVLLGEHDDILEPYILGLDRKTVKKIRGAIEGETVAFPSDGAAAVLMQAVAWAELFGEVKASV